MKAEIIAVGTELLLGQIVNTNAKYLSEECAGLGVDVYFQTVVGDNPSRIKEAFLTARSRADLIICTGGLGPTQDDLTKDVLAEFTGRQIIVHEPSLEKMDAIFAARGVQMTANNARQANMIDGAHPLMNDTGLAVGLVITSDKTHYMLLPGPPKELRPMFDKYAKPWIVAHMNGDMPLFSKMLKFAGIGESSLENALIDLINKQHDPTIAPYAKEGEAAIRLSTKAPTHEEAMRKMEATEKAIREKVGKYLYATEDIAIEEAIIRRMSASGSMLSVAESCTGGLLSHLLTSISGSSAIFDGGIVSYSNRLKEKLLNVPARIVEGADAPGAVSEETAVLMAEQVLALTDSDYSLSVTGVAGPGQSERKPVGLVYVALAERGKHTVVEKLHFPGDRQGVQLKSAKHALYMLWSRLQETTSV